MVPRRALRVTPPRRGVAAVVLLQVAATALVVGWLVTGHASAPDHGLLQLDVLSLSERVPGLEPLDGRPTMVVLTCPQAPARPRALAARFGLVVSDDPVLARRLALPRAPRCDDGYVLLDAAGLVRYRSYDPGWPDHAEEQEILLDALDGHHG
jgi:hypothetical protein